jgi:hypothetical protein
MSTYGRWEDALIAQMRLLEWSESTLGLQYLMGFFEHENSIHAPEARLDERLLAFLQLQMLREGEPVFVSEEACDVIDAARETFQIEKVLPGDAFTPQGFMLLARPLLVDDAPPTEEHPWRSASGKIPVRAIAWTSVHSEDLSQGVFWIGYYTAIEDEVTLFPDTHRWGTPEEVDHARRAMPLSLMHQWQWEWGKEPLGGLDFHHLGMVDGEPIEVTMDRARQQVALIQTIWRIASTFVPVRERAPRGIRRDAQRKGLKHEDVQVILLRRARRYDNHEPTGRTLTVRHLVGGHWRQQPYPSLGKDEDGKVVTRQIWIATFMKGRDDLPFKAPVDRAFEFRR